MFKLLPNYDKDSSSKFITIPLNMGQGEKKMPQKAKNL
jgi:hypothetical protein